MRRNCPNLIQKSQAKMSQTRLRTNSEANKR